MSVAGLLASRIQEGQQRPLVAVQRHETARSELWFVESDVVVQRRQGVVGLVRSLRAQAAHGIEEEEEDEDGEREGEERWLQQR